MSPAPPQKELFARPTPTPSTVFVNDRVCVQTEEEQDALFLAPPGTGKSHLAQAVGKAVIDQGYRVIYREAHILLEEIAEAALVGNRKEHMELLATVPLLIIDDLGMRKLGPTAAEELLEIVMRRYGRASTLVTSNRPVEDWGKLLRRQRRRHRDARSPPAPRPYPQMRAAKLENQVADKTKRLKSHD